MAYGGKWVQSIADLQQPDGSWGHFHTLSQPTKERPITTEQALRRLYVLGLTRADEPVQKALAYMKAVLRHEAVPPDGREKVLNWDFFEQMMMAAWVRRFSPEDEAAGCIAAFWAGIVSAAFASGAYDADAYEKAYRQSIPKLHAGERLIAVPQFYMVSLLRGELDKKAEAAFIDHILQHAGGIYYVYDKRIAQVPARFDSLQASRYIGALECLAGYACAPEKLGFAIRWLHEHKREDGWDLGPKANDGVYFPVSDSWRKAEDRKKDCTARIQRWLDTMA